MTDDQIRELLREMRDEPVPADSLARVRTGLDARLAPRRKRWWIPAFAAAAAAAATLALVFWPAQPPPSRPFAPAPPVVAEAKQPEAPKLEETKLKIASRARPVIRKVVSGPAIRIETPDPDVVLMIVTDGGGED